MNTLAVLSNDVITQYIAAKLLILAEKSLVFYQLCDKEGMKFGEGRSFTYNRYERLSLPKAALTEGVTPDGVDMEVNSVSGVLDQWGHWTGVSDVAIDSVKHPALQIAIQRLSMCASELIDREIYKVIKTGTNVYFPNAISARASLTGSDKISSSVMGKVVANLRQDGAAPYDGNHYMGVVDSFAEDDVMNDTAFQDTAKYGAIQKLMNNEIGTWKGVRWTRSNSFPALRLHTGASGTGSATAGSLAASTTYNAKLAIVDAKTGHETYITAVFNAATGVGETSVAITVPALPAGATAGSLYRLYFGSNGGTLYLAANDVAVGTYNQGTVPTSGAVAQASAPSGLPVHFSFVFGKQGVACVELNKVKAMLTKAEATDSDPLAQRRKASFKLDFKAIIMNEDFLARIEHVTTNN